MYRLVGLILLISVAHGQIQLSGSCSTDIDNILDLETFYNFKKLFGQWYEIERINNSFEKGDCSTLTMKFVFTFRTGLFTQLSHREVVNGQLSMRNGALVPIPPQYSAVYEDGVSYDFVVLKTNYNDYAILYSCQNTANGKSVMAWKLSRTPTPSYTSLTNFDTVVKNNTDLVNATWFTPSHSKEACTIRNNAINLQNTANGKSGEFSFT
ncbi:unnamed protein product [Euphydryas editha]|uniref:Lipocalin/cytosolic fatty-acid binding domain-containing protein n=1 Tax=Euphydryas editha TaxID=104508 RepID=A0AAU9V9J6_EUPED|nr:unnamed protein product [Euphydryas editha]